MPAYSLRIKFDLIWYFISCNFALDNDCIHIAEVKQSCFQWLYDNFAKLIDKKTQNAIQQQLSVRHLATAYTIFL